MALEHPRARLVIPVALAALFGFPAFALAQDGMGGKASGGDEAPKPKVEEPKAEIKGNRYRVTLKSGAKIVGLLPQGVIWEKPDELGEYVTTTETEKGAGLRLNWVLGMEGELFVPKRDIAEVTDLGALTPEQRLAIEQGKIAADRKRLEERERINREELAKIAAAAKAEEARKKGAKGGGKDEGDAKDSDTTKKADKEAKARKRGEELLAKFPPSDWGADRIKEIKKRSVVNGIYPDADEQEFIDNFDLWKEALARKEKEEAEAEKEKSEKKDAGEGEQSTDKKGDKKGNKKGYGGDKEDGK